MLQQPLVFESSCETSEHPTLRPVLRSTLWNGDHIEVKAILDVSYGYPAIGIAGLRLLDEIEDL